MAFLRTLRILEDIYLLFEESDFELRTNRKLRKANKDKLQIVSNANGTVTVVAPCGKSSAVYMTFDGSNVVELWPDGLRFEIDRNAAKADNRKSFHTLLTNECGLEFKNGSHSVLTEDMKLHMLPRARIIPQIFKVFWEDSFRLQMYRSNLSSVSNRFSGGILPCGQVYIIAGIENLAQSSSQATYIFTLFNGSDDVAIFHPTDLKNQDDIETWQNCHVVKLSDARQVLTEQYGVSFDSEWHMNPRRNDTLLDVNSDLPQDINQYFDSAVF